MNNKGFTLVDFTIWLFGIIVLFIIALRMYNGLNISVIKPISDRQVFAAAENYVIKENVPFNINNYVCVTKKHLEKVGYLKKADDIDRTIKLSRNKVTRVVTKIEYVSKCK